ncbi:MAG: DNA alkylation repair protein [Clostridia bacterium]|nr:DNA alkylation repair protein [Clostridia bacterium]
MNEQAIAKDVQARLFALQDLPYRDFQCKLMPTVDPAAVIGVRTPAMRQLAKEYEKSPDAAAFLSILPHEYYEENNLHGFLIERMKDYDACIAALNAFLPYVDNWATCDLMSPKVFQKHLPELLQSIKRWLSSTHTYTIRFGVEMLMRFYLDAHFDPAYLEMVAQLRSQEYYVNMMIAWYFATALAKQYDATLPYIEGRRLDVWAHNKAIQKAIESYRITEEQKAYLRTLKIK